MLFIILSVLLFSYNNVLWKKNLKSISIPFLVSYRAFFTSTISLIILFTFFAINKITIIDFAKITLGSLFGVIGLFSMLAVIKKFSLQWLGIYNLLGVIFTIVYLWIFDTIEIKQSFLGLLIIVFGFICYIYSNKETQLKLNFINHLLLALMTFSFSCSVILHWKNLTSEFPPLLIIANQEFLVFIVGVIFTLKQNKSSLYKSHSKKYFKSVFLMGAVIFLALLFSFLGLKETNPIISSLFFLATPLTTIVFSAFFFKEKVSYKNVVFITIIVIGAFMLHYKSS